MRESIKANLLIFFIIAIIAFCISSIFVNLTVTPKTDSYKLISIENNSFMPKEIEEVPTIIEPVNKTNTTNTTNRTHNTTNVYDNYTTYTDNYTNYYSYRESYNWRYW